MRSGAAGIADPQAVQSENCNDTAPVVLAKPKTTNKYRLFWSAMDVYIGRARTRLDSRSAQKRLECFGSFHAH